jgi:LPS-assembly lipoprotein
MLHGLTRRTGVERAARLVFVIALGLLAACGFRPLYSGEAGRETREVLAGVEIAVIAERTGQILRNELLDRLTPNGAATQPRYRLVVELSETVQSLGVSKAATTTRTNLLIFANFQLVENSSSSRVFGGSSRSFNSFNVVLSEFATNAAEADARRRAARDLAEDITVRIALFLKDIANEGS